VIGIVLGTLSVNHLRSDSPSSLRWNQIEVGDDQDEYLRLGYNIAVNGTYSMSIAANDTRLPSFFEPGPKRDALLAMDSVPVPSDLVLTAFRTPGYPLFIALASRIAPSRTVATVRLLQCVLNGLTAGALFAVSARLFGSRIAGFAAAAAFFCLQEPRALVGRLWSETLSLFIVTLLFALLVASSKTLPAHTTTAVVGLLSSALVLTRPNYFLVIVFPLAVWLWCSSAGNRPRAIGSRVAVLLLAGVILLMPWVMRNSRAFHQLIPLSTQGGFALASYNNDQALALKGGWPWGSRDQFGPLGPTEVAKDAHWRNVFTGWVKTHPDRMALLALERLPRAWYTGFLTVGTWRIDPREAPWALLLAGGVTATLWSLRTRWAKLVLAFLVGYQLQSLLFLQWRYLVPLDGVMAIAASALVVLVGHRDRSDAMG